MTNHFIIPHHIQNKAIYAAILLDAAVFSLTIILGYIGCGLPYGIILLRTPAFETYQQLFWLPAIAAPIGFYFGGLYRRDPYRLLIRSGEKAFTGNCIAVLIVLVITYILRGHLKVLSIQDEIGTTTEKLQSLAWGFPVSVMLFTMVVSPTIITLWRFLSNYLESRFLGYSKKPRNLLIIGKLGEEDIKQLKNHHSPCYHLVGYLSDTNQSEAVTTPEHLGKPDDLERVLDQHPIDEVLLIGTQITRTQEWDIIEKLSTYQKGIWIVADIYDTILSAVKPELVYRMPLFRIGDSYITGWTLVAKRILDIFVSSIVLLISIPLFLIPAAIAIVIDSKGFPVFIQDRVGQNGKFFKLYKLRTMVIDADNCGPALTVDNDPRITKFGNFLRRTSIDELPQLWNVLLGNMSLVGPRAVIPFLANQFEEWEKISLHVKPGLTGLAQISGRDEVGFREKSLLNCYYVRNYSIWLDLRIIISTIRVVLSMEGTGGTRCDD